MIIVIAVVGLVAATWLSRCLRTTWPARLPDVPPRVSVIVPARNEAAALPTLLGSLDQLDPPSHEVIVVDDESTDGTGAIAASYGAVVLVLDSTPPPGWLGKPRACQRGADAATGTHLLFLDADASLAPPALGALVAAQHARGGLVSVAPYHVIGRSYEELSAYANSVAILGSGAFAAAARAPSAFGPCLFTTADDYDRVGGHASVGGEVVEDVALARRYAAAGITVTCLAGGATGTAKGPLVRYRMYPDGWRQLVNGWSKNLAAGATIAAPLAVAGTAAWVSSHVVVTIATVTGVVRWIGGSGEIPALELTAWLLIAVHQVLLLRSIGSFRVLTAVAFPVPLAAFVAIFARSVVLTMTGGAVDWRGRSVRVGRPRS